jgi:hypothetical protein
MITHAALGLTRVGLSAAQSWEEGGRKTSGITALHNVIAAIAYSASE